MVISHVVAMSENRVIGKDGQMPWHIPGEQKIFKRLTVGKALILGRKTHESIGRVLPDRTTIIVSRQKDYDVAGAYVVHSIEEAIKAGYSPSESPIPPTTFRSGTAFFKALKTPYENAQSAG